MLKQLLNFTQIFVVYLLLCVFSFFMLRTIIGYTTFEDNVQFLTMKQDYIHNPVWKTAFYIHVFTAIVALLAAFTQFSKTLLKDSRALHRLVGRIYVWNILAINFPAGMVLAVYAYGQLPGRIAFVVLDCLWCYFTYQAFIYAKNKDFVRHKQFMIRSYALTFSAITLRSWKEILSHAIVIDQLQLYMIDSWLGFVPNLIIAELIIRYRKGGLMRAFSGKNLSQNVPDSVPLASRTNGQS